MVREYGPFRERFEEYILERTANHPTLVPLVRLRLDKAGFRLACKETLDGTNWSSWLDQTALDGPERVLIDEEISTCLKSWGTQGTSLRRRFQIDPTLPLQSMKPCRLASRSFFNLSERLPLPHRWSLCGW